MSILVATNLTPNDHAARELAAVLAKRLGEGIVLAHVLEKGDATLPAAKAELEKAVAELGRFGIATDHVLLHGGGSIALMQYVRKLAPRMIVIGTAHPHLHQHHAPGFAKTRALLSRIAVPVLFGSNVASLMSALSRPE